MKAKAIQKIYFIGIGGIGMSAIARYMNARDVEVYGYDKTETNLTKKLVDEGMKIHYVDDPDLIPEGIDIVVYTPAIPKDNKELNWLKANGYEVIKRAEMLGRLSHESKTIAIAGTHGKTSTSSITSHLLKYGGRDVSAFLGGIMSNYNSNYLSGMDDWIVVEADEYDRSFLHLKPNIVSIISMDPDHLDIYGGHEVMIEGFNEFISKISTDGFLIIEKSIVDQVSEEVKRICKSRNVKIVTYGEKEADVIVDQIEVRDGAFYFNYQWGDHKYTGLKSNMPGKHNIKNAAVAITISILLEVEEEKIKGGLETFEGIKRRFEKVSDKNVIYYDDYAHHPSELNAAIGAARMLFPDKKLTGIFQPHLFSRTRDFAEGFAEALDEMDEIILMDIYPARELPIEGVNSEMILSLMKNENKMKATKEELLDILKTKKIEVLMTLGAGDIDVFVPKIKEQLENG